MISNNGMNIHFFVRSIGPFSCFKKGKREHVYTLNRKRYSGNTFFVYCSKTCNNEYRAFFCTGKQGALWSKTVLKSNRNI